MMTCCILFTSQDNIGLKWEHELYGKEHFKATTRNQIFLMYAYFNPTRRNMKRILGYPSIPPTSPNGMMQLSIGPSEVCVLPFGV